MKITGTMSYIKVEIDGKTVKIEGEKVIGGFIAFKNTMKNWEPPYENEVIDEKLKQEIIQKVYDETKNSHLVITFE
ncbi:Immunity protein 74 [Clostridium amylolyticum]|uniref:Immunity protein 74 n=1 Tax=Clostridium amylolyticum TaxID=1121298 RepID=A0A1M6KD57_9CLOT|nr:Imm74 family immunity protein [Clostridium amylolyticum]SHJ56452.1 Immunity protein 74 [Clostridium amylolyticum]SHJ56842.1 Immunity protein 74 [Clostridium amylolyticum]